MSGVFISYRRSDAAAEAKALHAKLRAAFPGADVFWDIESIEGSSDFRANIRAALRKCEAMIVVIGPTWAGTEDDEGRRRLDTRVDYVRAEIEGALERKIAIIPLLIGGATMPSEADLPRSIKALAYRNALSASDPHKLETVLRDRVQRKVIDLKTFSVASGVALLAAASVLLASVLITVGLIGFGVPFLESQIAGEGHSNFGERIHGHDRVTLVILLAPPIGILLVAIYAAGRVLEQRFRNLTRLLVMMLGYGAVMTSSAVNIAYNDALLGYDVQLALDLFLILGSVLVLREFWVSVTYDLVTRIAKTLLTTITASIGIAIPGFFAAAYLLSKFHVTSEINIDSVLPWAITLISITLTSVVYAAPVKKRRRGLIECSPSGEIEPFASTTARV